MKLLTVGLTVKIEDSDISVKQLCGSVYPHNLPVHISRLHTVSVKSNTEACSIGNLASDDDHLMSFAVKKFSGTCGCCEKKERKFSCSCGKLCYIIALYIVSVVLPCEFQNSDIIQNFFLTGFVKRGKRIIRIRFDERGIYISYSIQLT